VLDGIKRAIWAITPFERTVEHLRAVRLRRTHPEGRVPGKPNRIVIEPTNACNLACGYCGNKDMVRPHTYLPLPVMRRMLDEMVELGIPRCTLHTIGEPTLHPDLPEMIRLAKERNRVVTLSTNGTLLNEKLARALVEAGPDMLHVSIDAADADVLERTRPGIDLPRLTENLRRLRRIRDEEGKESESPWGRVRLPTLAVTCVITPAFTRDVERRFFETFGPLVDDIVFHLANNHAGYVDDEKDYRLERTPYRLRRWFYKKMRRPCFYPWDAMYLLSDGTMSVCRFDFDARVAIGRYPDQTLLQLWNSPAMASLRRAHMSFDFRDWSSCEDCTGMMYENRAEHFMLTRRLKRRNGYESTRDCWQSTNPLGVKPGSTSIGTPTPGLKA